MSQQWFDAITIPACSRRTEFQLLTGSRLEALVRYDPGTGKFHWRRAGHRHIHKTLRAGTPDKDGYRCLMIDQRVYKEHRLAWLWMTGRWPKGEIDHINKNKSHNRFKNLREIDGHSHKQYHARLRWGLQ